MGHAPSLCPRNSRSESERSEPGGKVMEARRREPGILVS